MDVGEAERRLKNYLLDGIAAEIFWADEAYALAEEIGKHAHALQASGFGSLFGSLQVILSDRQTLSTTKIFDQPKKYPTRSIPATLAFLKKYAELWRVPQWHILHETLIKTGSDSAYVEQLSNAELTRAIVSHYEGTLARLSVPL